MDVGFLFDNDGVLVDTKDLHWMAWQQYMQAHPELGMSEEVFLKTFGRTNDLILKEVDPSISKAKSEEIASEKERIFRSLLQQNMDLLPGVIPFLEQLQAAQTPRIIASSAPVSNLEVFLKRTPLSHYFSSYVSAEQVARGKPYPDVFLAGAEKLGIPPEQCIVIEDSPSGLQAGKSAGCFVIAVTTTHKKSHLSNYDLCVDRLDQLTLHEVLAKVHAQA